jgi:hypothetical protein
MKDIELIDQTLQRIAQGGDMEYDIEGRDLERLCKLALAQVKNCALGVVSPSLPSDDDIRRRAATFNEMRKNEGKLKDDGIDYARGYYEGAVFMRSCFKGNEG